MHFQLDEIDCHEYIQFLWTYHLGFSLSIRGCANSIEILTLVLKYIDFNKKSNNFGLRIKKEKVVKIWSRSSKIFNDTKIVTDPDFHTKPSSLY